MIKNINIFSFLFLFMFLNSIAFAELETEIYSKIKCECCKKELKICRCHHSKEIKTYIEALLDVGFNEEDILIKVAKKYSLDVIINEKTKKEIKRKLMEEAGPNRPEIFIKPLFYNIGKIRKSKGSLELIVELQNKGNQALTINSLKTSCACTTVRLKTKDSLSPAFGIKDTHPEWKADIAFGEKAELIVITDLDHPHVRVGKMLRVIDIESNDPLRASMKIRFEAEIIE